MVENLVTAAAGSRTTAMDDEPYPFTMELTENMTIHLPDTGISEAKLAALREGPTLTIVWEAGTGKRVAIDTTLLEEQAGHVAIAVLRAYLAAQPATRTAESMREELPWST